MGRWAVSSAGVVNAKWKGSEQGSSVCASGRVMTAHEPTSEKGTQQQQQQQHTEEEGERERGKNESFDQIIKSGRRGKKKQEN